MSDKTINMELHGAVCVLTLNRPDRLNALTPAVAKDFVVCVNDALTKGTRAIDLREMQELASKDGRVEAFFDEPLRMLNEAILLIRQAPVPFIAAVNGVASGGGCNLALACDLVIAAESAKFNQAFVKIGLSPDCGGTYILPRLVGWKRATELMFTGDMIGAKDALAMGMINSVVADDDLMQQAMAMAQRLASAPTAAIAQVKKLLDASAANDYGSQLELERKAQIESGQTSDFREGVAAFLEKRPPRFTGG
jgi:2-(1,2-epoxy-1,2-dihydrophenyl)acetyl-CoA isomerase